MSQIDGIVAGGGERRARAVSGLLASARFTFFGGAAKGKARQAGISVLQHPEYIPSTNLRQDRATGGGGGRPRWKAQVLYTRLGIVDTSVRPLWTRLAKCAIASRPRRLPSPCPIDVVVAASLLFRCTRPCFVAVSSHDLRHRLGRFALSCSPFQYTERYTDTLTKVGPTADDDHAIELLLCLVSHESHLLLLLRWKMVRFPEWWWCAVVGRGGG